MLTQTRLHEVLRYNKRTGFFTRLKNSTRPDLVGKIAGYLDPSDGYWRVCVDGQTYLVHRLAWFYVKGVWPKELDHKDTNQGNNRWKNLRDATRSKNRGNSSLAKNNTSGHKGVRPYKNKFQARLGQKHLGYFDSATAACAAYVTEAKKHFGEFARAR